MRGRTGCMAAGAAALALATLAAGRAYAVWTEVQLTPGHMVADHAAVSVHVKDVENWKQFDVTVEPVKGKKLSQFTSAKLFIATADATAASVPVESRREGDRVTFWFRVAPRFLSNSRLDIAEQGYEEVRDADGHVHTEMTLGGSACWFWLRDLAR